MTDNAIDIKKQAEPELDLLEILLVLLGRKKLIGFFPIGVAVVVGAVSLAVPNKYSASTNILPPQQAQSGAASLLAQLGGVASMAAGVSGIKNPNDLYVGMLRSRTVTDKLVQKFGLVKAYGLNSNEKTRAELAERTSVLAGKDGIITISVEDENPVRASEIANQYVKELFSLTNSLAVTEAGQRRLFFERQLELTKNNLASAEVNLKQSLSAKGVISVDTESKAIVETVSRLRAQISAKEIQLRSAQAVYTPENREYKALQEDLSSLRVELSKLENGSNSTVTAASQAPSGQNKFEGLDNIKALRDLKYHQMLYELLAKQYEAARLDEAKEAPLVQVLDSAIPPERKSKPKRLFIVLASYFVSLSLAIVFVLCSEAKRKAMLIPERANKWRKLNTLLRNRSN